MHIYTSSGIPSLTTVKHYRGSSPQKRLDTDLLTKHMTPAVTINLHLMWYDKKTKTKAL